MAETDDTIKEGDILNLADCFKEIVGKKDVKLKELQLRYAAVFKLLMMSYSIFRMTDDILDQAIFDEASPLRQITNNIEYMRSQISQFIDVDAKNESDSDSDDE
jgi:hypothetical protein